MTDTQTVPNNEDTQDPLIDEATLDTDLQSDEPTEAVVDQATYNALEEKFKALNEQHMRLAADFENFRKRTITERDALRKYGAESAIETLLPVLDNLERGEDSLNENSDAKTLYKSFSMLTQQLLDLLKSEGLTKIEITGKPFDPNFCEAISQVPSEDHAENIVIQVVQGGYQLHDRVIRPAKVIVSTGPAAGGNSEEAFANTSENNPFSQAEVD